MQNDFSSLKSMIINNDNKSLGSMVSVSSAVKCFCMFDRNDYVHTMKEAIGFSDKSLKKYYNHKYPIIVVLYSPT